MTRITLDDVKQRRLDAMTARERKEFENAYAASALAIAVGEKVRDARTAAGLSQRQLAHQVGTSQAAIARLEAGAVGATLTTLQRVAAALRLQISIELRPAS